MSDVNDGMAGRSGSSAGRRWRDRLRPRAVVVATLAAMLGVPFALPASVPGASAATGDCGLTGVVVTFTAAGATSGRWADPAMWDSNVVPTGGQMCIPTGKTAVVDVTNITMGALVVAGTLRFATAGQTPGLVTSIEVTGRIEVAGGATVNLNAPNARITNRVGATVRVEAGGFLGVGVLFQNLGGVVDLTGGGALRMQSGLGVFEHGASGDPTPVRSRIVGGRVGMFAGTLRPTTGGPAGFRWEPGAGAVLDGTLAAGQSIEAQCTDFSSTFLSVTAAARNEGTISYLPRLNGVDCGTYLSIPAGVTFPNAGSLVLGNGTPEPPNNVGIQGNDSFLANEGAGTITVDGHVLINGFVRSLTNDGTVNVTRAGTLVMQGNIFDHRSGTITNAGSILVAGLFRLQAGNATGNPISIVNARMELGRGSASFVVTRNNAGVLDNPNGPIVVGPQHHITVDDGTLGSTGPVENRGDITLTGERDLAVFLGTAGAGDITNHGRIVMTSRPGTGTGGQARIAVALVNAADGVVEVQPGRQGVLGIGTVTNGGVIDLGESAIAGGAVTMAPTSTLRVHASASGTTSLGNVSVGTVLGGTLDVVTDAANPPALGASSEIVGVGRFQSLSGTFSSLTGAVSATLGYSLAYAPTSVTLQVVRSISGVVTSGVTAPAAASVGDDVTVGWTTSLGAAVTVPFTESVYLSSSPALDASSVLLGHVRRTAPAAAGVDLTGSLSVRLPSTNPGRRYLVVVSDSGSALALTNRASTVSSRPIDVTASDLGVGAPGAVVVVGPTGSRTGAGTGFTSDAALDGTRLLRLAGSTGSDVIVTVSPPASVEATAASGRAPTTSDRDVVAVNGTLLVPRGDGSSERYVLLRNTGGTPVNVTVAAVAPGLSITSSSPTAVLSGSPAPTAVLVRGTGFAPTSAAQLVCGATVVNATSTQVDGPTQLTSLFDLPNPLGVCSVRVGAAVSPVTLTVTLPSVPVNPASLEVDIDVVAPSIIRSGVDNRITVRWTNRTGFSRPAPLFEVRVDHGTIRYPGSPGGGTPLVEVLGIAPGGPAGVLAPGATNSIELVVRGVAAHTTVGYTTTTVERSAAYDLGTGLAAAMHPGAPAAAAAWVAANGPAILGLPRATTAGGLERHLGDVATILSGLGRRVADPSRLVAFDLERVLGADRASGFRNGELGVGQPGLAIPRLSVDGARGDVIVSDGGTTVRFARNTNGTYLSPPTSADVLSTNGSGWTLTARDGTRRNYTSAGLLSSIVDPQQRATAYSYDGARLVAVTSRAGQTTRYAYDASGRIATITDGAGRVETFSYDGLGRMTSTTAHAQTLTMTWDADNLATSMTNPDGVVRSVQRDAYGRITTYLVAGQVFSQLRYQADGSITTTDASGAATTVWFDDTGAMAKQVDAAGHTTAAVRDDKGAPIGTSVDGVTVGDRLLVGPARTLVGQLDGAGGTTSITTDVDGLIRSRTDQDGRTTTIVRNGALRPTAVKDPLGATSTVAYDAAGRLQSSVDRTGRRTDVVYTAADRTARLDYSGYGSTNLAYDAHGNLTSAAGPTGTTTFTYDAADRLVSVSYPTGLGLAYAYDGAGRRASVTTSDGQEVRTTYDARGRLANLTAGSTTIARYEYDALDRLTATSYGNGSRTDTTRDVLGRVTRQRTTCCTPGGTVAGPTVVSDVQLGYDVLDRVATRTDATGTTVYSYDGAGRLISAATAGPVPRTVSYGYDRNGNRITTTDTASGPLAATLDGAGRPVRIGAEDLRYDASGRQLSKGTSTYGWDPRGALATTTVAGTTTTYVYDALGTPIARTTGGTTTNLLVDPSGVGFLVGEYSASGARQAGYAWGQGLGARLDSSGTPSTFYTVDPHGDVVALSDATGAVTDTYRYLPFGEVAGRTGTASQPFGFQGALGLRTDRSGLVNARARTYDPALGRFLSEDPDLFSSSNPMTWVSDDPLNRTDLTGRWDTPLSEVLPGPVNTGLGLLGINTAAGSSDSDDQNAGDAAGLLSSLVNLGDSVNGLANASAAQASHARELSHLRQLAGALEKGFKVGDQTFDMTAAAGRVRQSADALMKARPPLTGGPVSKLGLGLNVAGGLKNIYDGWTNDDVSNGFLITRQIFQTGLKVYAGRFLPIIGDIIIDQSFSFVDVGSNQFFLDLYGVDPTNMWEDPNHPWNARKRPPGKKHPDSTGADAWDPNSIVGPAGVTVGSQRFVAGTDVLPYEVHFENQAAAALPAGEVTVTHVLDADVDLSTFALGGVGFGSKRWEAPANVRAWSTVLDDRDVSGLDVILRARLDVSTRTVTWTFTGIDPATGDRPAQATRGFLPRNVTSPQGEGFVSYTVQALTAGTTGTAVTAQASIVFDANPAIATNVDTVVLDSGAPTAAPSVPPSSTNPVTVTLGAADDVGGSGVAAVDLWASKEGGTYELVAAGLTAPTYAFAGVVGSSYAFRVAPADAVGNVSALSAASGTVAVTSGVVPVPPVAVADAAATAEDTPLAASAPGVLANDTDGNGDALTARLVTGPAHGTLTLAANGSYAYAPAANFHGTDTFTYVANDGTADSPPATVTITVTSVNDAPVAQGDIVSGPQDAAIVRAAPGVLANDTDADGDALTARIVTAPAHGTLTLAANGSYIYTPTAGYAGADSFTYVANDGTADSPPATVAITLTPVVVGRVGLAVADAAPVSEWTGPRYAEFVVTLDAPRAAVVQALVATYDGTARAGRDYSFVLQLVTFRAGEVRRTVRVPILADCVAEGEESFTLRIIGVLGAPVATGTGRVVIAADPVPQPAPRPPDPLAPGHTCRR